MSVGNSASLCSVQHVVDNPSEALVFYERTLLLSRKFVDGTRYAALEAGGPTLALVSAEESLGNFAPAGAFRVLDVAQVVERLKREGGSVKVEPAVGPHEARALVADPWGNSFIVYSAIR